jgi:hypothetical protein
MNYQRYQEVLQRGYDPITNLQTEPHLPQGNISQKSDAWCKTLAAINQEALSPEKRQ